MAKQTFTTGQVLTAAQMTSLQQTAMGGGSATAKTANYVLVAADAGTTVAMNAAGATTITVNTGLFAAGDTVLIQNLGAGVCTVTAGTATVSTAGSLALVQFESGVLYFTATGTAIFNDYVQAGGGSTFAGCLATISGSQTISNGVQTKKTFTGTDTFDTDGFHDPSSNDSRITIPTGMGGYYLIYAQVNWDASTSGRRIIILLKNNTSSLRSLEGFSTATNTVYPVTAIMTVANLSAGDYIEVELLQTSGGNLNTDNGVSGSQFGVVKLG